MSVSSRQQSVVSVRSSQDVVGGTETRKRSRASTFGHLEVNDEETMSVILDYIRIRCENARFYWCPPNIALPEHNTSLLIASRKLCSEYEDARRCKYDDIYFGTIHVDSPKAGLIFKENLDSVLHDAHFNWGRISGILVYGAELAIQAFTVDKPELVKEVVKWVYDYLQTPPVKNFIALQGGWGALEKDFKEPPSLFRSLFGDPHTIVTTGVIAMAAAITGSVIVHNVISLGSGQNVTCATHSIVNKI